MAKKAKIEKLPEWEELLSSISRLQNIVPDAVLVGGSAAAIHAGHRFSKDHDHTVQGLRNKFDVVLKELEAVAGWKTASVRKPVQILGSLDGIETGVRNLIRTAPLEVEEMDVGGVKVRLPTAEEALRIKMYLAMVRNTTRDYLDLVALSDKIGEERTFAALDRMDELYPQDNGMGGASKWVVRSQMVKQLGQPEPYDLDDVDLSEYKGLVSPYDKWEYVREKCGKLSAILLAQYTMVLSKEQTPEAIQSMKGLEEWREAIGRGEKMPLGKLPGMEPSR